MSRPKFPPRSPSTSAGSWSTPPKPPGATACMLENCNYGYNELLVLNMVKAGHVRRVDPRRRGVQSRPARPSCFRIAARACGAVPGTSNHNGNLYPTHGLGPVANYMDINRGDRFEYLVSDQLAACRAGSISQRPRARRRSPPEGDLQERRSQREPDPHRQRPRHHARAQHLRRRSPTTAST